MPKTAEQLWDEIAGPELAASNDRRRGFGAGTLKAHGRIFAMLSQGRLVVKLPAGRVEELIASGVGGPFDAGKGRPMKEWLAVEAGQSRRWRKLIEEARTFVASR